MYTIHKEQKKYWYMVDIYKFLLTIGVCLMHYEGLYLGADNMVFEGFYLAVDFFFVLSGFLLYRSLKSKKYASAWDFTLKKVKEFMGYNVIMVLLFILYNVYTTLIHTDITIREIIAVCCRVSLNEINELFFLQMFLPSEMYNFPIWYISVLLVVGYWLYLYIDKHKNAVEVMPLIAIVLYMLLYIYHGTIDLHVARDVEGLMYRINPGIFRGIADMALGVVGCTISEKIQLRRNGIIRIVLLGAMLIIIFVFPHTTLDYVFPSLAMICIVNEFSDTREWKNAGMVSKYLRKISLSMYFVHVFVVRLAGLQQKICELADYNKIIAMAIEMVIIAIASIALESLVTGLKKLCKSVEDNKDGLVANL